jgi:hypothetical protein
MNMTSAVLAALAATFVGGTVHAQVVERSLPRLVHQDGRFALFVDDAPFLILQWRIRTSVWRAPGPGAQKSGAPWTT